MITIYTRQFPVGHCFEVWKYKSSLSVWPLLTLTLIVLHYIKWSLVRDMIRQQDKSQTVKTGLLLFSVNYSHVLTKKVNWPFWLKVDWLNQLQCLQSSTLAITGWPLCGSYLPPNATIFHHCHTGGWASTYQPMGLNDSIHTTSAVKSRTSTLQQWFFFLFMKSDYVFIEIELHYFLSFSSLHFLSPALP